MSGAQSPIEHPRSVDDGRSEVRANRSFAITVLICAAVLLLTLQRHWFVRVWTFGPVSVQRESRWTDVVSAAVIVVVVATVWLFFRRQRFVALAVTVIALILGIVGLVLLVAYLQSGNSLEDAPQEARRDLPAEFTAARAAAMDDPNADPVWSDGVEPVLQRVHTRATPAAWLGSLAAFALCGAATALYKNQRSVPRRTWLVARRA